ncbi:helix-turn-helix domain-containing protein [Nocardia yunnanensis]|nr:LysR family transcriptional regulator [Nocardia yunnanensis]
MRQLRPALSMSLLLVGTRLRLSDTVSRLDSPLDGQALSRILQLLQAHPDWPGIRSALTIMADYLCDHRPPIDYRRRRHLDYTGLLTDTVWQRICRDTGTRGTSAMRARITGCYLFERISGMPAESAPGAVDNAEFRTHIADFPSYLTPQLATALDEHAADFLAHHHIRREPVVWRPPGAVLAGLHLPGEAPETVDVAVLHELIGTQGYTLGAAANGLGITLDLARYVLDLHPAPPRRRRGTNRSLYAFQAARAALPADRFIDLYHRKRLSLDRIAVQVGVSRHVLTQLADSYGIARRAPGNQVRAVITRDWLYDQYVQCRRPLPDLAREVGISNAAMARWAKFHAIPMRGRGGPSHAANLAARSSAATAPALLQPALGEIGGHERLRRFVAAARYDTLTHAAKDLDIYPFSLIAQINRLERDFGETLFQRAQRGHPMALTEFGRTVLSAWESAEITSSRFA